MAHHFNSHDGLHTIKVVSVIKCWTFLLNFDYFNLIHMDICFQPKHLQGSNDLRVILAEYILNFDFPRDIYTILITGLVIYITLKLFRFSIGLLVAMIRPIIFLLLILVSTVFVFKSVYQWEENYFICQWEEKINFHSIFIDCIAVSLWDENGCYIKPCDIQCIFSNRRHIPKHLWYIKLHLQSYDSILCEKLLIQHPFPVLVKMSQILYSHKWLLYFPKMFNVNNNYC